MTDPTTLSGRGLDEAVAAARGWKHYDSPTHYGEREHPFTWSMKGRLLVCRELDCDCFERFEPSTDPRVMVELMEELRAANLLYSMSPSGDEEERWRCVVWVDGNRAYVYGATPMEAVARAYLLAKGATAEAGIIAGIMRVEAANRAKEATDGTD